VDTSLAKAVDGTQSGKKCNSDDKRLIRNNLQFHLQHLCK
jgi:hypothetical protein